MNSFMGEGASATFGTEPRLPATTSLYDRTMALSRIQNRKSSLETARNNNNNGESCKLTIGSYLVGHFLTLIVDLEMSTDARGGMG